MAAFGEEHFIFQQAQYKLLCTGMLFFEIWSRDVSECHALNHMKSVCYCSHV